MIDSSDVICYNKDLLNKAYDAFDVFSNSDSAEISGY